MSDRYRVRHHHHPMDKGRVMKNKGGKRGGGCRLYSMKLVGTLIVMKTRGVKGEAGEILLLSGGSTI